MGNAGSCISVHEAARVGQIMIVRKWVEMGLSPDISDNAGQTPLHHAAQGGQCEVTEYLIHSGADLDNRDSGGDSPLHIACYWGRIEVIRLLLSAGASTKAKDCYGNIPSDIFDDHVPDAMIEYIKMLFQDPILMLEKPMTPVQGSDAGKQVGKHAFFSQNGVVDSSTGFGDVNKSTGQNNTVLNTEIEQIIQNSETPKWINRRGRVTSSVARFRKEKQRSLSQVYNQGNGRIDLHAAARDGQTILLNYSLRNSNHTCESSSATSSPGYDVDEKDSYDMTPLAWAAHFGRLSAAKCLLDHGANIEATCGVRCWRPLHFASYYCHPAVVRIFVERGAETRAKDKNGMLPGRKFHFRCYLPFIGPSTKDRRMITHVLSGNTSTERFDRYSHSVTAIFPMNSPLEAYDVLDRPVVVGFPFFGHGKKGTIKKRKSSSSDQTQTTVSTTHCQHSSGKGIRYYLERASLIQEAAAGAVVQRVNSIIDKVAHRGSVSCGMICIIDDEEQKEVHIVFVYAIRRTVLK